MTKTVMKIDGMMCGMCEAHMNEAVRNAISVKKVTSSHKTGETTIITDDVPDEAKLREAVGKTGYTLLSITSEPYETKGFTLFRTK